jgi:hypothetical protein
MGKFWKLNKNLSFTKKEEEANKFGKITKLSKPQN